MPFVVLALISRKTFSISSPTITTKEFRTTVTLTPADEEALLARHMNRVTDTCIPEMEAMRRIETAVLEEWVAADKANERYFPHEFMYKVLRSGKLEKSYQADPKN